MSILRSSGVCKGCGLGTDISIMIAGGETSSYSIKPRFYMWPAQQFTCRQEST